MYNQYNNHNSQYGTLNEMLNRAVTYDDRIHLDMRPQSDIDWEAIRNVASTVGAAVGIVAIVAIVIAAAIGLFVGFIMLAGFFAALADD